MARDTCLYLFDQKEVFSEIVGVWCAETDESICEGCIREDEDFGRTHVHDYMFNDSFNDMPDGFLFASRLICSRCSNEIIWRGTPRLRSVIGEKVKRVLLGLTLFFWPFLTKSKSRL